jgi:acetyltransferase
MTTRYMRRFFDPRSIAVIGASERSPSLGGTVLGNLLQGGFPGSLMAVNPRGGERILGVPRYDKVAALPEPPDLAVICTAPATIPQLVDELGRRGVHAVLIVMGGLSVPASDARGALGSAMDFAHNLLGLRLESGKTLKEATWEAARPYDLRIMGPNCIGVVVPGKHLNASYAHCTVPGGGVAYVGQSGMLALAMLDWADGRGLGLSHLTSLGDSLDIDIADVLEYLADEVNTRAILLHVEQLDSGRRFISGLRAAARNKLVLVMKSRRVPASREQPEPATPGLADGDVVYDAALRRAGVLRVERLDEVFNALETLTRMRHLQGERLAVLCNGIGPALLASDHLVLSGGELAGLDETTREVLRERLPSYWTGRNPIDLNADATPGRFERALEVVLADPGVDAVLVLHVPTLIATSLATAEAVIAVARDAAKPVLTSWLGDGTVHPARTACDAAGISTFDTPEEAVDAFMHMVRYRRNQDQLYQTPPTPGPREPRCDSSAVWALLGIARNSGRELLTDEESMGVVTVAGIPVAQSSYAREVSELGRQALGLDPPYAIKILSDATCVPFATVGPAHRAWRGVALDLGSVQELEAAANTLARQARRRHPELPVHGFKLQRMRRGLNSLQLSMGIVRDRVFGPLLFFGTGGNPSSALADRQVGLPPLNAVLARALIESTAAGRALGDFSANAARDRHALSGMLVRLGQLSADVPAIAALEINPLVVNREGIVAIDAKIAIGEHAETAIPPYPQELEEAVRLARSGRTVVLRPIRGEDAPAHAAFVGRLSPEAIRYRFFQPRSSFTRRELAQATQIDYAREMAFIATTENTNGSSDTLGVVRAWIDPDNVSAEFAIIVDDALRGQGLGRLLLEKMITYARQRGVLELRGTMLPDNRPMQGLARTLGFSSRYSHEDEAVVIALQLNEPADDWQRERLTGA